MSGSIRTESPTHSSFRGDPAAAATPQAIVDRRELAFIAMERTHMPMVVCDARQPDCPIVMANRAFFNLTGYRDDEVVGRNCRFLQGPDTSQVAIAEIRASIAEGRDLTLEILNYRKDGTTFWNELHLSPIRDDDGQVIYIFGSQRDISERHTANVLAASEHRLLREVDHRAMNVLALVDGIVRLSKADSPPRYAASVQQRVQSLAKAHSLLASHGWRAVPLEELIRTQVEPFGLSRVDLSGPKVSLAAIVVQPLALVLHELIANAATHGALSAPDGALTIHWSSQTEPAEVTLMWSETGGPAPARERVPGFGSMMISGIVERQLGGALSQTWNPAGLTADIRVPMDRSKSRKPTASA